MATTSMAPRLLAAIKAVVPAVTGVSIGVHGNPATVTVTPSSQQAAAQATINAFDWGDPAQASFENVQYRNRAADDIDNSRAPDSKRDRAVADTIIDELNVLRGIVIGTNSLTFNPASMANGTGLTSSTITVTGAAFGDFVDVAAPYNLQGIIATAYVTAANTVAIRLHNGTGAAVDLASGVWNVIVRRQGVLAPRTLAQAKAVIKNKINSGAMD